MRRVEIDKEVGRMAQAGFWKTGWFPGLVVSLGMLLAAAGQWLGGLERTGGELALRFAEGHPSGRIAVIAFDAGAGSRLEQARLIERLSSAPARIIVSTLPLAEPDSNPVTAYLEHLRLAVESTTRSDPSPAAQEKLAVLADAKAALDGDAQLGASLARAGNVLLPILPAAADEAGKAPSPAVLASRLPGTGAAGQPLAGLRPPLESLAVRAQGLGILAQSPQAAAELGAENLVFTLAGQSYPALSLAVVARSLAVEPAAIGGRPGRDIRLGKLRLPTDSTMAIRPRFYAFRDGRPPFPVDSAADVLSGRIAAARYADKIVLLGVVAGASSLASAPVVQLARSVSSILQEDFVVVPYWAPLSGLLLMGLIGAYLVLLLPRLASRSGAWLSLSILLLLLAGHCGLLLGAGLWLPLIGPACLLVLGQLLLAVWRLLSSVEHSFRSDVVPAASIASEPQSAASEPLSVSEKDELSRLGRYVLDRVLGKGAMGRVYQGYDPQIGRPLAIKTMALVREFDADALGEVRQRFFREAESAGRLSHPNIVTIYDAGEVDGLAYIAMELLPGRDLLPHTRPDALLPRPVVLSLVARVADALDYAHRNKVVHRDIKPANIMYDVSRDLVKVTDFGVARITDSSRTRTGMVLGTPSYMAPEQLAGKHPDGRSDLYALGVMLYQLLSGRLPFIGDSLGKLMFSIANEAPFDILTIKPDLPAGIVAVVAKSLNKNPDGRYQQGAEMAAALRACLEQMESRVS